VLGYRHIELSGKVLGVLLIAEVAIVLNGTVGYQNCPNACRWELSVRRLTSAA
jgi:hypothetical protein